MKKGFIFYLLLSYNAFFTPHRARLKSFYLTCDFRAYTDFSFFPSTLRSSLHFVNIIGDAKIIVHVSVQNIIFIRHILTDVYIRNVGQRDRWTIL